LICAAVERFDMHRGGWSSKFQKYKKTIRLSTLGFNQYHQM